MNIALALAAPLALTLTAGAQSKLVTPAPTTGGSPGFGLYFDLTATSGDVVVTHLASYFTQTSGSPVEFDVFTIPGGYAGKTQSLAGWTVLGSGPGVSAGATTLSQPIDIPDIELAAGQKLGVCLHQTVGSLRYHVGPTNPTTYTTAGLSLTGGVSKSEPFTAGGQTFEPRVFSGEVIFESASTMCYADCDASSVLDFFDFLCFQNAFVTAKPYADCDHSGSFDFFDYLCFQNSFAGGCP